MTPLEYRETKGYKYIVASTYRCAVPELVGLSVNHPWFLIAGGELTVSPGYAWDGASGPTLDTPATMQPSLVHDVGYQCIRSGLLPADYRATFDAILYRMMRPRPGDDLGNLERFWAETRALYYFAAVRAGGWSAVKPKETEPQDKVYVAT